MRLSLVFFLLSFSITVVAQEKGDSTLYRAGVELQSIVTSNNAVPFWLRTNQYGSIPSDGFSGSLLLKGTKTYQHSAVNEPLFDWGGGIEARMNLANNSQLILTEAYLKARILFVQLKAGRSKEVTGLVDSSLSVGAFAGSGNALGIPKIDISIPEFWDIPFTKKLIAVKGNFAHGWFGKTSLQEGLASPSVNSYYHQKSLYGRIGKPHWKVNLYGGFNHQVMWGNEKQIEGNDFSLSAGQTYWYVISGKAYGRPGIPVSKIGNHIGSIDQAVEVKFNSITALGYHQFFYEVGGLYHGNNLKDGLWGISIRNNQQQQRGTTWRKILFEFLASKSQGGELDAPITPSGDEDYYNNYIYAQGWTYKGQNLGNNFFTQKKYAKPGQVMREDEIVINNRLILYHLAINGVFKNWDYLTKISFSSNLGTYASSPDGTTTGGDRFIYPPPYFEKVNQLSAFVELSKKMKQNFRIGFLIGVDNGGLLNNSVGGLIKLSKEW